MADRINHAMEAARIVTRMAGFADSDMSEVSADISGLTHAVLAMVEQQRIANLIAYTGPNPDAGASIPFLDRDIRERLGL